MLPLYISYFAGEGPQKRNTVVRAAAFIVGFMSVFCALGIFAGTAGSLLVRYRTAVNIICGAVVIVFGLSYLGFIPLNFFKGIQKTTKINGVFSAFLFGVIYSVSLTPCVGAFLGSALMMASVSASATRGLLLLFVYSLGMGIPFILAAVLIDRLKGTFDLIKKNYHIINTVCGIFLIIVGVLMMTGLMGRFMVSL